MKKFKENSNKMNQVTENQKLDLFKVEELEDRLEMAAVAAKADDNGICWVSK